MDPPTEKWGFPYGKLSLGNLPLGHESSADSAQGNECTILWIRPRWGPPLFVGVRTRYTTEPFAFTPARRARSASILN